MDGCDCEETQKFIAEGKLDTEPLTRIDEAYELFEEKRDGLSRLRWSVEMKGK